MTEKVKEYKISMCPGPSQVGDQSETNAIFTESNVSLYRYGGFALHSLIKKHEKQRESMKQSLSITKSQSMSTAEILSILKQLKVKENQRNELPSTPESRGSYYCYVTILESCNRQS